MPVVSSTRITSPAPMTRGSAVAGGDLHAGVEVDDVLAARRRVPVEVVIRLDLAEDDPGRWQALRQLPARPVSTYGSRCPQVVLVLSYLLRTMTDPRTLLSPDGTRWRLLAILTTSDGVGAFGTLDVAAVAKLLEGLGLTRSQVAFIVPSIYLAGRSLPGGRLADRSARPAFLRRARARRGRAAGRRAGAGLPRPSSRASSWPAAGLERGERSMLGKGDHGRLPGARARHRDGRQADGSYLAGFLGILLCRAIAATLGWRYAVGACRCRWRRRCRSRWAGARARRVVAL